MDKYIIKLFKDSVEEAKRAKKKFPKPELLLTAMTEEHGELVKAIMDCRQGKASQEDIKQEMIQLIAMIIRLFNEGDPAHKMGSLIQYEKTQETP
jgi:NTP pyrophosphatase (non-canonical NTP hydrolase)